MQLGFSNKNTREKQYPKLQGYDSCAIHNILLTPSYLKRISFTESRTFMSEDGRMDQNTSDC